PRVATTYRLRRMGRAGKPGAATGGDTRRRRATNVEQTAVPNAVDDSGRHRRIERGAPPASADAAAPDRPEPRAHIGGGVHDDPALHRLVVDAGFEADQRERRSVSTGVRRAREERAETRAQTRRLVAEAYRPVGIVVGRRAAAVRNELVEDDARLRRIEDPQAAFPGRQRVVDDGEE